MVTTKVFVGNLSFQTKEAELATEFGNTGKVISANIITRGPRSLGYGFVEMESEQDAENAVKVMNKKEINGRPINVEIAKPQDETKERPPRQPRQNGQDGQEGGNESRPRRPKRRTTRKREGEGEAQEKGEPQNDDEGKQEIGRRPRRKPRNKSISTGEPGQKRVSDEQNREESKTTLFVANLPFALDDDGFGKVVTDAGLKLKTAHVVKKRNGRSKGYGFIEFDIEEDQKKALVALNKKVVESRELSVKIALTEIKTEGEESREAKPVEKKVVPAEKKTTPVEKKTTPPAEKKAAPAEKKTGSPAPAEKKAAPAEKKTGSPAPAEKKTGSPAPAEKKTGSPAPGEKKTGSPAEKKTTPEKKDEKK